MDKEGKTNIALETFKNYASRAWDRAPIKIKDSKNLYLVKKNIKKYVITLPV